MRTLTRGRLAPVVAILATLGFGVTAAVGQAPAPSPAPAPVPAPSAPGAQAPEVLLPQLRLTVGAGKAPAVNAGPRPGPTEVVMVTTSKTGRRVLLVRLEDATPEEFRALTEKKELRPAEIDRLGKETSTFMAQGTAIDGAPYRTTVDLEAGSYVVLDITSDKAAPQTAFTVAGTPTRLRSPKADAFIDMRDYGFTTNRATLPADGTLRIRNVGEQLHFTLAFPTGSAADAVELEKLLIKGDEKEAEKLVAGRPREPAGLISPGVTNRTRVRYRPGDYVLVCFYSSPASQNKQHNRLGMVKRVRFG